MKIKDWNLAIVGLPDSGKSTFLARLYGTVDDGDSVGAYSLSFPPSIDCDNDNSLAEIKDLWTWVKSHFDEKKKTLKSTRFSMLAGCPGPSNALKIIFEDHPGELFQPKDEHDIEQIDEAVIEKERKEFRDKCPRLNAIAILIEADKAQDEGNLALLKSMLAYIDKIAPKGDGGQPVFKVVVFTKAYEADCGIDGVRDACRRFTKTLSRQGRKNLRVLACESLEDLVEDGGSWKLPSPEDKRKFPNWILTPTEVIVALLRMRRSWIMRRRVLLTTAIGFVISLIAGATWFLGKQADQELYEAAMREGNDANGTQEQRIEHYLDPNRHHDWFYPVPKNHRMAIAKKYKDAIWGGRGTFWAKNLDEREAFLEKHRKSAMSPIANTTELSVHIKTNNLNIADAKTSYDEELTSWEKGILASGDTNQLLRAIDELPNSGDPNYPEKSMPSLRNKVGIPRQEKLKRDFDVESNKWNAERDCLVSKLEAEASFNCLSDLLRTMNADDYAYYVYRKKRENELLGLLDSIPVTKLPFWCERLISPMSNAFEMCTVSDTKGEAMAKLAGRIADIERRRSEVLAASVRHVKDFKSEIYANRQKEVCKAALEELTPDCAEYAAWKDRKDDVDARCAKSAKLKADIEAKVIDAKDSPKTQLEILSGDVAELVPEDRESLDRLRKEVEDDWRKLRSKWGELVAVFGKLKPVDIAGDHREVEGALKNYDRAVEVTGRAKIIEHAEELHRIAVALLKYEMLEGEGAEGRERHRTITEEDIRELKKELEDLRSNEAVKLNAEKDCLASELESEKTFNRLSDLLRTMKLDDFAFCAHRKEREIGLLAFPDRIPVSELPFWSERLIAPMSNAFETCVISGSRGEAMSKIAKIAASVNRRQGEVLAASVRHVKEFKDEKYGNRQKEVCKAAFEELTADCAEYAAWKDRNADVDARCAKSAKLKADIVARVDAAKDAPKTQLDILSGDVAELVPEDREFLDRRRKVVEDDWRKISTKWEELAKCYDGFKAPKGSKQYLQLQDAYDAYCRTVKEADRSCIIDHKKELDEIRLACTNEEKRVSDIAKKADAIHAASAIFDKDDSAYYAALDAIIAYRDTYNWEKANKLVDSVKSQILDAATKGDMSDDEFLVWQNRISKVLERSSDLGIDAKNIEGLRDKLKANWEQCRFDSVARMAEAITDNDKWAERAAIWKDYRMLTNVSYEVRREVAAKREKEEIKKGISMTKRLLSNMDKSGEEETSWELSREEYDSLKIDIENKKKELENKAGRLVTEVKEYEDFLRYYNGLMNKKICVALCQHYKNRLQAILTDNDKKLLSDGVMIRWTAGEAIRGILREMAADEVFVRQNKDIAAIRKGFDDALNIIARDTPTIKFSIKLESFKIHNDSANDKDSPAMEIRLNTTNSASKVRFEKDHEILLVEENETDKIAKYDRQYPKKDAALRDLRIDEFKASTNTCMSLQIRWKDRKKAGVKCIDVPILKDGDTLAQLSLCEGKECADMGTMKYKWTWHTSEYRFSDIKIKIGIDDQRKDEIQKMFTMPTDVESFFDRYRR